MNLLAHGGTPGLIAELSIGFMLALARHISAADAAMKRETWEKKKFLGEELRDKTLGLAGLGRIGQEVARRAQAFGMRIIAHDPFISEQIAAGMGIELVSLDDVAPIYPTAEDARITTAIVHAVIGSVESSGIVRLQT